MSAKQNGRVFCSSIETNFKDLKQDDWENDLEFGDKNKDVLSLEDNHGEVITSSKAKSVEFVSAKYDDLAAFKKTAMEELWKTKSRLNEIFDVCDHIEKSIDAFEKYTYQFKDISINGNDIIHRVPSTKPSISQLCSYLQVCTSNDKRENHGSQEKR